jgi:hypothetical protein
MLARRRSIMGQSPELAPLSFRAIATSLAWPSAATARPRVSGRLYRVSPCWPVAVVPELPATEYTVCLDRGTYPASPGAPATIIVVQNVYADRYPNDVNMTPPTPVWVRVVGTSGRVMRRIAITALAPLVQPQVPGDASCLSAGGPMPVPLQGAPAVASLPPVESYGYRQALYQHWTIEP